MKQICLIILFLPTFLFTSCQFRGVKDSEVPWLEMEKTACRGQCPEYKVQFYDRGVALYEGISNVPCHGKYYARINPAMQRKLKELVKSYSLDSYKENYYSMRPDLPSTYIRYLSNGRFREITDYDNAPASLRKFEEELEKLAEALSWKRMRNH